ncbi:S8 family serine peptidase [Paraburkholderia fungorum]|uniref:S8 family serine peptidase n=1 Tax=Paraburkholderia fungorum TaxID=134537 RepID=UPI0038B7C99D
MRKKKREFDTRLECFCAEGIGRIWSKLHAGRVLAGAVALSFGVALSACGGSGSSVAAGDNSGSAENPVADKLVEAAASAASSGTVPLRTSLRMNATSLTDDTTTDRFIVRYKTGTTERGSAIAVQSRLDRFASAFPSRARHSRRMGLGSDVITTQRKLNAKDAVSFMRAIASDPNVEYVEPDVSMSGSSAPNDPMYRNQWGLKSNLDPGQPYAGIRVEGAWTMASGAGVVIGVVDSGVTRHSDLNANVLPGYDFTFETRGGDGSDTGVPPGYGCSANWHGTHVTGIAAALANNGIGIAGVAPAAKVVSSRALNGCAIGSMSGVADAILWAAGGAIPGVPVNAHPSKIINVSLGGKGMCSATYQNAIDYAINQGVIVVVAAGNDDALASEYQPANCHGVVTVGNSQPNGSRYRDSNYGPTVDIAAPGANILSTHNAGTSTPGAESYAWMYGTSMSAPMVSGVIALAQSVAPKPLTGAEMRTLLQQHAQPFPVTLDQPIGAGIVDATATVAAAKAGEIPTVADFRCTQNTEAMQLVCKDLSTARGAGAIRSWDWDYGAGKPHTIVTQTTNPVFNYDLPGSYQVTLKVTDAKGLIRISTQSYRVGPTTVTDLTYMTTPVVFSLGLGEERYFSVFNPGRVVKSRYDPPFSPIASTLTLTPAFSNNVATLDLVAGSLVMTAPDCTVTMKQGIAASCQLADNVYYFARVRPAPKTTLNSVSININPMFRVFYPSEPD